MRRRVWDLAHGRSGDKGDVCNIGVIGRSAAAYETLRREVTVERVRRHFGDLIKGSIERYELPNIWALNFVCRGALNGGGTLSLRSDHLGKVMYTWLLHMEVDDE